MGALIVIPFAVLVVLMFSQGTALTSQNQSQGHGNFWVDVLLAPITFTVWTAELSVKLAKYLAHFMFPALRSAEKAIAGWFAGHATILEWQGNHAHRTSVAVSNVTDWANTDLREEILDRAKHDAGATAAKNAFTKAPPLPQRRLTQHEVDVEFRRLIDGLTPAEKQSIDPKWDWDPSKWRKYLGILPALGSTIVHPNPTHPAAKPNPHPLPPGHLEPLPHTDDHPNPDPGTQRVPSVQPGKDKWARGQIVKLNKKQTSILKHLGPLAFLALPVAAIATLIGLLECRNFKRLLPKFCNLDSSIIDWLLGVALAAMTVVELCNIAQLAADAATAALPALEELLLVEDAVCLGGGESYPSAYIPGNHSTKIVHLSVI